MSLPTGGEPQYGYDEEIELKELIIKIKEYYHELKRNSRLIVAAGMLGGLIFGGYAYLQDPIYPGYVTFMVNDESSGNGLGGAAAILGQFGFGGGSSEYNLDKIVALAKSNKIVGGALLDEMYTPLLANQLIEIYDLNDIWEQDSLLKEFTFRSQAKSSLASNKALGYCIAKVRGDEKTKGISNFDYEEDTGILTISVNSIKPELSISLSEAIYSKLAEFYIQEATEKPKQNYLLLQERADSVYKELAEVEEKLAKVEDGERGIMLQADKIKLNQLQRSASILTLMYGEIVKNKETANFILKSKTPFFQVVDKTVMPIEPESLSVSKYLIAGVIITIFLLSIWIIVKMVIIEIISK